MIERIRDKAPFPLFDERMLEDYCRHGLEPDPTGWISTGMPPGGGGELVRDC